MKRKAPSLPRDEWDFTHVQDLALPYATLWEYARTSDKIRTATVAWLETKIGNETVRELTIRHLKQNGVRPNYPPEIEKAGWLATLNTTLFDTISGWPDFPLTWPKKGLRYHRREDFKYTSITPLLWKVQTIREDIKEAKDTEQEWDLHERLAKGRYHLSINWGGDDGMGVNVEDVINCFAKWARKESKKFPHKSGQKSQAPTHALKCLSAYRMSKAGFTFDAAQMLIDKFFSNPSAYQRRLLPLYAEASGWSDAIRVAKQKLAEIEAGCPHTIYLASTPL